MRNQPNPRCRSCRNGHIVGDVECVNGILIDIDVFTEGHERDVVYPPAPCHPDFCTRCNGSGRASKALARKLNSDDCPECDGSGYRGGRVDCQKRLAEAAA